ncbi:MAG: uroporphyrinogen-III C-methyltransferase [Eggerthellaceae bacterium]|nr:uroporphyrinogen-III C-methyltransferase [Eggerthellaceae bacterium]
MSFATVYLVGAGPGDAGLLTLRAKELLESADCVVYDYLASSACMRFAHPKAEQIFVGKKGFSAHVTQDEINACLLEVAARYEGGSVVRLKGGDPYVFGRGGEEALVLHEAGVPFEVVPGVTAAVAACAYAGIPVTHRGVASSVALVTGHETPDKDAPVIDWDHLAQGVDTLCFYMGIRDLPHIVERLMAGGRSGETPVALVRWGTTAEQETLTATLETVVAAVEEANFQAPAIIVVGEVVGLRDSLTWFENRPLFGKRFVVTRTREQASSLVGALESLGADVVEFPTIEVVPRTLTDDIAIKLGALSTYDWVVFTSANGVKASFELLDQAGADARSFASCKIAGIGPATTKELAAHGLRADLVPDRYIAESVAEALIAAGVGQESKVCILRASAARDVLPELLEQAGAAVDVVHVYDTLAPKESEQAAQVVQLLRDKAVDAVTFSASSTVRNFFSLLEGQLEEGESVPALMEGVAALSIGTITSNTIEQLGLTVAAEADPFTIPGLVEAAQTYFA